MNDYDPSYYDAVYQSYRLGTDFCRHSVDSLAKAERLVSQVVSAFGLKSRIAKRSFLGKRIIDVGCGLGFVTEAFRLAGAQALGIDASPVAVDRARKSFPSGTFLCKAFPDEIYDLGKFDLVFARDLSLYNTLDVDIWLDLPSRQYMRAQNLARRLGATVAANTTGYSMKPSSCATTLVCRWRPSACGWTSPKQPWPPNR